MTENKSMNANKTTESKTMTANRARAVTTVSTPLPEPGTGILRPFPSETLDRVDPFVFLDTGAPINEPIVMGGNFVMNTEQELHQANLGFRAGKFGRNLRGPVEETRHGGYRTEEL